MGDMEISAGADLIRDGSDATFRDDVVDASMQQPVIVDFWAPWCGPCKQLGPALEAAVQRAGGKVKMVKINVDENPIIAGQLQVQSIPAVYAFANGQPVDGFMGAQPTSQIDAFVEKLAANSNAAGDPVTAAMEQADELMAAGQADEAAGIYTQVLEHVPDHIDATVALADYYLKAGAIEGAQGLLDGLPEEAQKDPKLDKIRKAIALKEEGDKAAGELDGLRAALDANPEDHQARFDLAVAIFAMGETEEAMAQLLEIFAKDREWNDNAARLKLLELFEAVGHAEPVVIAARKKLSSLMFSV